MNTRVRSFLCYKNYVNKQGKFVDFFPLMKGILGKKSNQMMSSVSTDPKSTLAVIQRSQLNPVKYVIQ